jgi:DNA polymerase-3 subunit gamma/tau
VILTSKESKDAKEHLAEVATSQGIVFEDDVHIIAQKQMVHARCFVIFFDRVVYCGTNLTHAAVTEKKCT